MKENKDYLKPNVMLVDDNEIFLKLFKKYFEDKNYNVFPFTCGNEALETFRSNTEKFDLVVLDVIMPNIDGFELCRQLRLIKDQKQLPVIMVTSKSEPKEILKGFEAGANDYVSKPFDKEELLVRSKTLVELKRNIDENDILNNELKNINKMLREDISKLKQPAHELLNISSKISDNDNVMKFADVVKNKTKILLEKIENLSR